MHHCHRIAEGNPASAFELLQLHRSRTALDAQGELLLMELGAMLAKPEDLPAQLEEATARRVAAPALLVASAFRGLRLRNEAGRVLTLMPSVRPELYAAQGGGELLRELVRSAAVQGALDRVAPIVEQALRARPDAADVVAAHALLLEMGGDVNGASTRYAEALGLNPAQPHALLGRARAALASDSAKAAQLGMEALAGWNDDPVLLDQVFALATQLEANGARDAAHGLFEAMLKRVPHSGEAAAALCRARLTRGDHSDRTLDLAARAARFAASEQTQALLREVRAARDASVSPAPAASNAPLSR